jgi:hypothetical protein
VKFVRMASIVAVILFAAGALTRRAESQAPNEGGTGTKVVLLGTGTPIPDPDRSGLQPLSLLATAPTLSISDPALYVAPSSLHSQEKFRPSNPAI